MDSSQQRLTAISQGRSWLPLAMRAVSSGNRAIGMAQNAARVELLVDFVPYMDDIPDSRLREALRSRQCITSARILAGHSLRYLRHPANVFLIISGYTEQDEPAW